MVVTHFKDIQEAQKKLDQTLQVESMKRAATEMKTQEQISGIDEKYDHLTTTIDDIQLQLLNMNKSREHDDSDSILGSYTLFSSYGKGRVIQNYAHSHLPRI